MGGIKTVSIIGVGLIGGSLGMVLKARKIVEKVIGVGRNPQKLQKALDLKALDEVTTDLKTGVRNADLVVICTPVGLIVPTIKNILSYVKPGCILTDVGSVKGPIVKEAKRLTRGETTVFIGGHPMAGSEQAGIDNARADLFAGATWALTPAKSTPQTAIKNVEVLIKATGARVINLDAKDHDRIVAFTSHLPHLLADALVHTVGNQSRKNKNVDAMTAGSFRDVTRIALSSPEIWKDIFIMNKKELLQALTSFNIVTQKLVKALQKNNEKEVNKFFAQAQAFRRVHGKASRSKS